MMHFDGPCLFLLCLEQGPHDHPVCSDCHAVRYGNAYCKTCRANWPPELADVAKAIDEAQVAA